MNEEEKKAIEILKEIEINTYAEGKAIAIDTVLKLIKKLQKENEELKNNKSIVEKILHKGNGFTLQQTQYIWEHYIPVQKVKDKIEEIDKIYNDIPEDEGNFAKAILIKEKQVLQELLEGRK